MCEGTNFTSLLSGLPFCDAGHDERNCLESKATSSQTPQLRASNERDEFPCKRR